MDAKTQQSKILVEKLQGESWKSRRKCLNWEQTIRFIANVTTCSLPPNANQICGKNEHRLI